MSRSFLLLSAVFLNQADSPHGITMEQIVNLHIEKLPGLIAQGRTVSETVEIARNVARKLIEARGERDEANRLIAP